MSDIFTEKKAFNFYRSYYDTSLLLTGEDRLQFLDAILHYQFTGEIKEPESPMALLAFRGQIHSLKKQVVGYEKGKTTYPNGNPTKGADKGSHKGSHKQVQVQVQEEDKVEVKDEEEIIKKKTKVFTPPTLQEVKEYFKEKGYNEESAEKAFNYYSVNNWIDSKGNEIKSWKQKMIGVWFNDENKIETEKPKKEYQPKKGFHFVIN